MMKKMSSIDTVLLTSCMLCILDNFLASMRIRRNKYESQTHKYYIHSSCSYYELVLILAS